VILEDDQGVFPAGNPVFVASQQAVDEAGPDFQSTIETVQRASRST
jgi:glycine betaine/choline ABC-type transport system substrate-binding protein